MRQERANSTTFTGESYELRVAAAATHEVEVTCRQEPTGQVLLELAQQRLREAAMLGEIFQHLGAVRLHGPVELALFGPAADRRVPAYSRRLSMGVRRVARAKGAWLDACRRWRRAISGKWARSGVTELVDSVAVTSGSKLWSVAALFFGLWLIPMGYVAATSGRLPKGLGLTLIVGGGGYLVSAFLSNALAKAPSWLVEGLTVPGWCARIRRRVLSHTGREKEL